MTRIVALLAVRNEELYIERCLDHLFEQGIETCVIDNDSNDRTRGIVEHFIGRGVFRIEHLPYAGFFDLVEQLRCKERLASEIDADWFIHYDADEIRESPKPFTTLQQGIEAADRAGYTAINFEEFVFVPTSPDERFENRDYVAEMRHYYFFSPGALHRVNAWKKTQVDIDLASSGGHQVEFSGRRIYPDKFILRHYIILSAAHARRKYGQRVYSRREIEQLGWNRVRAKFSPDQFRLPMTETLKHLPIDSNIFDRSEPKVKHLLFE
jgi:glycosyltransferase involved in cell wall biosynthesis